MLLAWCCSGSFVSCGFCSRRASQTPLTLPYLPVSFYRRCFASLAQLLGELHRRQEVTAPQLWVHVRRSMWVLLCFLSVRTCGSMWSRCTVYIPVQSAGKEVRLSLGVPLIRAQQNQSSLVSFAFLITGTDTEREAAAVFMLWLSRQRRVSGPLTYFLISKL